MDAFPIGSLVRIKDEPASPLMTVIGHSKNDRVWVEFERQTGAITRLEEASISPLLLERIHDGHS